MPKMVNLAIFLKNEACGQTELPDRSVMIGQKLVENAKMPKVEMRHFEGFSNNVERGEKVLKDFVVINLESRTIKISSSRL